MVAPASLPPANAQSSSVAASRQFNIPAQALTSALAQFGRQSGLQVAFPAEASQGVRANAVVGSFTPQQALSNLLAGTGIVHRITPQGTAIIGNQDGGGAAATVDGAIALDTIDVSGGGGGADAPYRTPGTSAFISKEQLDRIPAIATGDIFREVPGVLSGSSHNGTAIDVNIRGMQGMNRVKVTVEGTQQESSTYRGYGGPDNRTYVDQDFLSGVEVEKGPSTGPNSAGAIGGVVNMRTLSADDLIQEGKSAGGRIRTSFTGNMVEPRMTGPLVTTADVLSSENWTGSAAVAVRHGGIELVGAFSRRQLGNYLAGSNHGDLTYPRRFWNGFNWGSATLRYTNVVPGQEVPNTSEDTTSGLLKAKIRWDDNQSLELGYIHYESDFGLVFPSQTFGNTIQQYGLSTVLSRRYYGRYKWNPADNDLVDLTANVWGTKLSSWDHPSFGTLSGAVIDTWSAGGDISNRSKVTTSLGELKLHYGAEYSYTDTIREREDMPAELRTDVKGTREVGGVFGRSSLSPTNWLTLDAGLRFDAFRTSGKGLGYDYEYPVDPPYFIQTPVYRHGKLEDSGFSPSFGVTVTPLDGLQLFAKYSKGWRPPSLNETYGPGGALATFHPSFDLKPERSDSFEFGVNVLRADAFRSGDKLRVKAAYFNNDYTDYIARYSWYENGSTNYRFTNLPGAKINGIEATVGYDTGRFFTDLTFNYYTKVEYCFRDAELEAIPEYDFSGGCSTFTSPSDWMGSYAPPKYSGTFTLGARLFDGKLTTGGRLNFFGTSPIREPTWQGTSVPKIWFATQTLDLFANLKLGEGTSLNFSVENVFDTFYISPLVVAQIPAPGRTARVALTMQLGDTSNFDVSGFSMPKLTSPGNGYNWSGPFAGLIGSYSVDESSDLGGAAGTIRRSGSSPWFPYTTALSTSQDPEAPSGGLFAGYNLHTNSPLVVGFDTSLERGKRVQGADQYSWQVQNQPTDGTSAISRTLTAYASSQMEWEAKVRGRVGFAFDRFMPYIAGGLTVGHFNYGYAFALSGTATNQANQTLPNPSSLKDTYVGWTLGAGLEHAMTDNLLLRAEFNYSDLGNKTFDTSAGVHRVDLTSHEWRLGVAYKF
jgi:hemoglobin/transferrin/lactoferrin receptor protein